MVLKKRDVKIICVIIFGVIIYCKFGLYTQPEEEYSSREKFISVRQTWNTSALGSRLFKFTPKDKFTAQNRTFNILVWKYWDWLKKRHVYQYNTLQKDPLDGCSVKNCLFTGTARRFSLPDAVIVHLQHGVVPQVKHRNKRQRWIFLTDESPINAFSLSNGQHKLEDLADIFNWSMTFRSDSDVPVPYGRTVPLDEPIIQPLLSNKDLRILIPHIKKKRRDVAVTILISNCAVKSRLNFIKQLQKHIPVDVYGSCSDNKTTKYMCPGHFKSDCEPISEYIFYLVLENSNCHQYITEKIWYHAYMKGAIPIIMGPSLSDCEALLPPSSFLHISSEYNDYDIQKLVTSISKVMTDEKHFFSFHKWRNEYKAINEHGYFGTKSYHLCRVCEALNYNDGNKKIYTLDDIRQFLDPKETCYNN